MRRVRALPLDERRQVYMALRVQDQIDWYQGKSNRSMLAARVWFRVGFAARGLALISAFVYVVLPSGFQLTEAFVAVATAVTAWTQLGRYEELSQSYGIAAHELSEIARRVLAAADEGRFGEEVIGAEGSISRERKTWAAKRM